MTLFWKLRTSSSATVAGPGGPAPPGGGHHRAAVAAPGPPAPRRGPGVGGDVETLAGAPLGPRRGRGGAHRRPVVPTLLHRPLLVAGGLLGGRPGHRRRLGLGVCAQRSAVAVVLSVAPLRFLGRISYGMYLWHYPLFIWLNAARTGLGGYWLFGVRTAVTVVVATASFYLVERPIRRGAFFRDWRAWVATPVAAAMTVAVVVAATTPVAVASVPVTPPSSRAPVGGPKIRVLVVGDSTALTLGIGLSSPPLAKAYHFTESDQGQLGCGVTIGSLHEIQGQIAPSAADCLPDPPPGSVQWPEEWQGWIDSFQPNLVVLLAGRWEVVNRTYNGRWTNILDPAYAAYVKSQLQRAVDVATSRGAHMVMMTAPSSTRGRT